MSFANQDRYIISDVVFNDPVYASFSYASEWFPADSSTYFDFSVTLDDVALVGMEFSNSKGGSIINTVSERGLTDTLCTVTAKSQGSWVRMFVRQIGLTASNVQSAGPFVISTSGFYYKNSTIDVTNRVHDLCAWADLGSVSFVTPWVLTNGSRSAQLQVDNYNAGTFDVLVEWSSDGINIDASDSYLANAAYLNESLTLKGRYVRLTYGDATVPNRWNGSFFFSEEVLIETSVLTTDSTEDLQISTPSPGVQLITVGNKHGGTSYSQSLYIDQEDPRPADSALENSVFLGNRAGSGDGGSDTRYANCVCVGAKSLVKGSEAVCIGSRMSANSSSGSSVTIGAFSKASDGGVTIGRLARPHDDSTIRNVCIGAQSEADSYGVSIGYNAGNSAGPPRNYAICLGYYCDQPGADGRLAFGSNMEGVQSTASAGAQTLPANPTGFIRLEWNGTLYKIPVYND